MITGDIIPGNVRDSRTFDTVDDIGRRTSDNSDSVETRDVVDCARMERSSDEMISEEGPKYKGRGQGTDHFAAIGLPRTPWDGVQQ